MNLSKPLPTMYGLGAVEEYLGMSRPTIRKWIKELGLKPIKTPGGWMRLTAAQVNQIEEAMKQ